MKLVFDLGGVITKYPEFFRTLILSLSNTCEIYCISDIPDKMEIVKCLRMNDIAIKEENVYSADYTKYGEMCKAVLCKELKIDCIFDDFVGYLMADSSIGHTPIRLHVQPNAFLPYCADNWISTEQHNFSKRIYTID